MNEQDEYFLNTVELNKIWADNWEILEVDFSDWDKKKDYESIKSLKNIELDNNLLIESHGRFIILIPLKEFKITELHYSKIKKNLEILASKEVILKKIQVSLENTDDIALLNVFRKGIGEILTKKIEGIGFKRIGSGGGIGNFIFPDNWLNESHEFTHNQAHISRVIKLAILLSASGKKCYLTADIKGRYEEKTELKLRLEKLNLLNHPVSEWFESERKLWQIQQKDEIFKILPKEIVQEFFEIQEIKKWDEISSIEIGYGKYAKRKWIDLIESGVLPADIKTNTYVVVKTEGRIIKDPNKKFVLPIEFFYKILSKPEDKKSKEEFKKFTQLTPQLRNKYISEFFQLLEKKGISKSKTTFRSFPVSFANTGVGSNIVQDYGKAPPLQDFGVESWGNLRKIDIFFFNAYRLKQKVEDFSKILKQQLEIVQQKTFQRLNQKIDRIEINLHPITDNKFIRTGLIDQLDSSCCPIVFLGQKIHNYREIKSRLTQERGIPVQGIKEATLYNTRNITGLVRTIIPQIIAKTGGFPYKLHPPILDNAIIIGLDKARDSSLRRPSASAGVAAVTPEGQYISGASTPLENNTTDFIDVDKLAPNLLLELDENKFNKEYEYVVILRDGSPNICRQEVPLWKKHLEEYGKNFIFLASRKTHPYRVFPIDILEQQNKRRVDYTIPAVLNSEPLPAQDFLVLAAKAPRGTPKPMLYTVMENTTSLNMDDVKEKVLAQIISMSILCWESPLPTSQPLPLHYADKLAGFTQMVQQAWNSKNQYPMFI